MGKYILILAMVFCLAGCGNVYVMGDAKTALETSAMDAWLASQKPLPAESPAWVKAYLEQNFIQWRSFARSANKNETWGPKLPSENAAGGTK